MQSATDDQAQKPKRSVLITGATGFIGRALVERLKQRGDIVYALSRDPTRAEKMLGVACFQSPEPITEKIDAIVHLAGANVMALPWTAARKALLKQSRLGIADQLLEWSQKRAQKPKIWLQASAVGFYPTQAAAALNESSAPGSGFAAELCQAIEERSLRATDRGARVVNFRFGLVLGRTGGVYPLMRLATKLGGGACVGNGRQRVAWIHVDDAVGMLIAALDRPVWRGAVNAVAPHSPSYREFTEALAGGLRRPAWLNVPAFLIKLALGARAPLLLEGAQIVPQVAAHLGHSFMHPELTSALADLT